MEQLIQQYIEFKGLDQQQAQQLYKELQSIPPEQLQSVAQKMQAEMQQAPQQAPQQHQMSDGSVMEGAKHEQEQYMQAQYGKGIENSPNFRVANGLPIHESMGDVWDYIDEPHKAAMKLLGGNGYENYSDIVERKIKNNPEHFAHNWNPSVLNAIGLAGNIVLDPINYIPISKGIAGIKTMNGIYYTQKAKDINSAVKTLNGTRKVAKGWSTGDDIKDTYSTIIKKQYGGLPVSYDGLYEFPNQPVVVPNGRITMKGLGYPVDAYNADTMAYLDRMYPNQEYEFDGVDNVLEIPQAKFGIQKMQSGGKIAMNDAQLKEYLEELEKDKSEIAKKHKNIIHNFIKDYEKRGKFTTDDKNQAVQFVEQYIREKHKNDKPVNYLNSSKKYPVKAGDFKSSPASNPTSAISTPNYSGNSPVEAIDNSNLRVGNRVDTVGGTPVRDFGITNKNSSKKDEYGFITGLKPMTTKKEMLPVYKESWVEEWNAIDPNFKNKTFAQQQAFAKNWVKTNARNYYDGLSNSFQGYNIDKLTADNKFGSITNQLRPSFAKPNLPNGEEPVPNFVDAGFPVESGNSQPTKYTGTVDNTPIALPQESKFSFEDAVNPADAIIGKLDNRDMSGRYLSNMKLRNNEIKLPYFQQVDLKTPQLYQQDIRPYVNNLYTGYNAAVQNIDMNSAVGQAQALQLNANLDKSINDVSGTVYNQNLKAAIDWENQLTGIYNQQSQLDNQNRAAYSDGVDLVRTNKQNVDNQIDALAYEHKMKQIQNQNKMVLSTLLHPDFYTTDEGNGQMVLKRKYNKAPTANSTPTNTNPSIEAERDFWKDLALKNSKTKAAKYGIGKKKAC